MYLFDYITHAQKLFDDIDISRAKSWHLCYDGGTLSVRPANHLLDGHPILFHTTAKRIQDGFTAEAWQFIGLKIKRFVEGNDICLNQ